MVRRIASGARSAVSSTTPIADRRYRGLIAATSNMVTLPAHAVTKACRIRQKPLPFAYWIT